MCLQMQFNLIDATSDYLRPVGVYIFKCSPIRLMLRLDTRDR